jgi:hypothetical protein
MAKMNHNRPMFAKADVWNRYDQYQSPNTLSQADQTERRYAKLDPLLLSYDGTDQRMLGLRDARVFGQPLSNGDHAWAFQILQCEQ